MKFPSSRLVLHTILALLLAAPSAFAGLTVTSVSPDDANTGSIVRNASWGGRVQNLAIDLGNDNIAYAATEWGGLYKTFDGANSWIRLDNHLPNAMFDVAVNPGNTGTIYATSLYDGKQVGSVSGIQVSFDGGATWTHPVSANPPTPCPLGVRTEPSAFGISVAPDNFNNVFIGTNCGLAISNDAGVTWTHVVPTSTAGTTQLTIIDVVAQAGGIVDVFGGHGHTRSTDSGVTWGATNFGPNSLPGSTQRGSITSNPLNSNIIFAGVGRGGGLWESDDAGANWTNIDDTRSNRTPFVSTIQTGGNSFDLWFGDGVKVNQVSCGNAANTPCGTDAIDGTVNLGSDRTDGAHDDATDIEFRQDGCPFYFSSDGGVYRNDNCPGNPGWVRAMAGIRAMWVFGFDGSEISGPDTSLHFGVQDDGVWASPDAGASWDDVECCDGFDNVADEDRTVYTVCCGFDLRAGDADDPSDNNVAMPQPPTGTMPTFNHLDTIDQYGPQSYVAVTAGAGGGVFVTTDEGSNWIEIGNASTPANACGVRASVSLGTPTFYVKTGSCNAGAGNLFKYSGTAPNGTWTAADSGLTAVGAFGVDPGNPNRLYAADVAATPRMMFSNDGGNTWQPDANLDQLMTGNGVFEYVTANGPAFFHNLNGYAQPTMVAFDPDDSNRLIAAAVDSGVFASTDGGQSWGVVATDIPRVYHAYFDTLSSDVFIGSQGRGIWRIHLASADLGVTKVDAPDPVNAGEQLFYTITVENFGPDDATDVVVTDTLPDDVDFITDDLAICSENVPGTVTCSMGDLAVGATATVVLKVKVHADVVVDAGLPTSIQNTVSVSSAGTDDPDTSNNAQTIGTIVEDLADLAVTKLCEPDRTIPAGETAVCTIIVDNYGPSEARNVVALDALASEGDFTFSIVEAPDLGDCYIWNNTWTCNLGVLPAATETEPGRVTVVVEVEADERVDIADLTKVVSNTPDPDITNNESSDVILVQASANLSLTKDDDVDPVVAGENLTYTLNLANSGPSTAEGVVVTDVLPAGVTIVSVFGSGGASCNPGVPGDPFVPTTCSYGNLSSGDARTMTVVLNVDPDTRGQLENNARISADTVDPNSANDLASESTQVVAEADLTIAKADEQDPVIAGEILDYELTVTNAGPSSARNVVVTDVLPAPLTFMSATILDGSGECVLADPPTNTVECHIGELMPNAGTPVFIAIKTRVDPSTPDGPIVNNASVASTETSDPVANDSTSETTEVITRADLVVEKTASQDTYKPSSQVIYTVTVTNLGSSDAQNVVVTDVLPTQKHDFLLDTAGCTGGPTGTLTCDLGTLAAGQVTAFNIHIKMKGASGEITNTASVTSSTIDPDGSNNTDVLVNLVKGGTSEGGGSGPGNNGAESLEVEAECLFEDPTQLIVKLRWTPGSAALHRGRPQRVEVSQLRGRFEKRQHVKHVEVGPRSREIVLYDLKGALVHYGRVSTHIDGKWVASDVVEFETPGCAPAEDMMDRE